MKTALIVRFPKVTPDHFDSYRGPNDMDSYGIHRYCVSTMILALLTDASDGDFEMGVGYDIQVIHDYAKELLDNVNYMVPDEYKLESIYFDENDYLIMEFN